MVLFQAATRLQNLLPRQNPTPPSINGYPREVVVQKRLPTSPARVVNIQRSSPIYQQHQEYQEPEVNIENQVIVRSLQAKQQRYSRMSTYFSHIAPLLWFYHMPRLSMTTVIILATNIFLLLETHKIKQ